VYLPCLTFGQTAVPGGDSLLATCPVFGDHLNHLGEVADHTAVLAVACSRCERAGQYRLETLIARHGEDFGIPELLRLLSDDCPKRKSITVYDLCGVHCPELPRFFLGMMD
jgi:hypothetical protein